jgi:hypothetical protein
MELTRIADHLRSLEEQLLDPAFRRDSNTIATLLADDFLEFGSSGRSFDKASILVELKNEPTRKASLLSDFSVRELSPNVVLVTYRATSRNLAGQPTGRSWRSSIWMHLDGRWQLTFHQGTRISELPDE